MSNPIHVLLNSQVLYKPFTYLVIKFSTESKLAISSRSTGVKLQPWA